MDITETSSTLPSTIIVNSTVGTNGFYTDYPRKPQETFFNSPDRIGVIVGCVLGTFMFIFLLVAALITVKLRQKKKQEILVDVDDSIDDWKSTEKYQHSKISHEYIHHNADRTIKSFSLLDPHSAFSVAVKKASEIPNSPSSPKK
ncbi:uncharacterized protein ATC70_013435 [Mucor velutinosus]|uniref:Uncharacterized protein n=1 Tax=Mucor velutinosus TaxID=708070 RepID=A0AAN7D7C3_9FUNG|nr:hypothetical protein ATC70_013435 [Mucor velutinosus]